MLTFCNDIDLLHWEPNLLRDAAFASQQLISGTGNLAGSTFTIASGSFVTTHVTGDQVIVLTGATSGSYPIVSVDGATQLTLSVLYDGLFPVSGEPTPTPPGTANGLSYAIRTFWPQRRIVSELLLQAAGLDPSDPDAEQKILNPEAFKRACTLGTLHLIYSALAAAAVEPTNLMLRVELYERLYRRAIRCATVKLDLNLDGRIDALRRLNVMDLERV
ncbi:MAG: hypothetical protein QOF78_1925 [Phycisphaerales bacterium]|jgi:hypothetical protein|nr:hypothetical protein [Phycisphaerales bacterium]